MYSGYSLWWAATYSLPSRLEFHARLGYSAANALMSPEEVETLWPADGNMGDHSKERKSYEFSLFELGASYPFFMGQRHRFTPGLGVLIAYERIHLPSHTWAVRSGGEGYPMYYGWIGAPFYRSSVVPNFTLQLEYTFHFNNGFFVGINGHCFYDFFGVNGITFSPVLGVRFQVRGWHCKPCSGARSSSHSGHVGLCLGCFVALVVYKYLIISTLKIFRRLAAIFSVGQRYLAKHL